MYSLRQRGFTVVELLIVVVVIAILAAITIVVYNNVQAQANDAKRFADMAQMEDALALYNTRYRSYPTKQPNPGSSSFEISSDPGFLSSLQSVTGSTVFKDPINTPASSYWYNTFPAGAYGCPVSMGPYYVLWARGMEAQSGPKVESDGCTSQTLFTTTPVSGAWTIDKTDYLIYGF